MALTPHSAPRTPHLLACIAALLATPALAQIPSSQALEQAIERQPGLADVLRQRIAQSGLSAEQVRARLRASGYPATMLDAYLGAAAPGQAAPVPGAAELAAIQALGMPPIALGVDSLPVDTGLVRLVAGAGERRQSEVFGVDVFRRTTTQFLPLLSGHVPPDYKLGPGDVLVLILTGDVELAYTLAVTREGFLLIPQVGQVHVASLTLDQLRDVLYARLGRVYSGVRRTANATTRFDITVANVRANQVYVVGEVAQPGAYQLSSLGTVLTALYAGGGITERANTRAIAVRRLGRTVATFDLYDYLLKGDTRNDIRLETGDVIFVPVHGVRVRVAGAVLRAAVYELKPGETLADLVAAAGGFRPEAAVERVRVERVMPPGERRTESTARTTLVVPLSAASPVRVPAFALEDGDVVTVDALPEAPEAYYVAIAGMVRQPGAYPWRPGMTLRELLILARGPRVGADLREVEIARMPADRRRGQLAATLRVPLDSSYLVDRDSAGRFLGPPGMAFPAAGSAGEVALEAFDNVLLLPQPDFELQRTVTITGEVEFPGTYALTSKDERLADLVRRAGGLTRYAYAEGIRFVRAANAAGRIDIDLVRALRDAGSRDNVILQPGDSVAIPEFQPSVRVVGAVNSPGSVLYRRGAGLEYYLSAAGGLARDADGKHVSVRFANGEVRTRGGRFLVFGGGVPDPGPGSEVFVPAKDPEDKVDYVSLFGAVAQILASTVAIIVVVTR